LLALHNVAFVLELMRQAREQLRAGAFATWSAEWLARYQRGERA
jgi:queuine tRNA-ribosyltransferase